MALTILHTSDWHLGRSLYGQKRYEEFDALLEWMLLTLQQQQVDILLIAGDIFDTGTPSNRAMQQYYRFLTRVSQTACRHVIIIGGNHDSPTFLNAPRELLQVMNVHVIGACTDNPADEVIVLRDREQRAEAIVCATPYLRDRDVRTAAAGESVEDKEQKLLQGIREHYAAVADIAEQQRQALPEIQRDQVPVIGMGHLFTAGGRTAEGDGVRPLYVGSLAHVGASIFPDSLDYVALGHLHVPQAVGGNELIRYCGSPLPMGFGEARQQKSVCLIKFEQRKAELTLLDIPVFQQLRQLKGNLTALQAELKMLQQQPESTWVEVIHSGDEIIPDLREKLEQVVASGAPQSTGLQNNVSILRIKAQRNAAQGLSSDTEGQTLDDLTPNEVFERCLHSRAVPEAQRAALKHAYQEILTQVLEHDVRAD